MVAVVVDAKEPLRPMTGIVKEVFDDAGMAL
jgi:hypothetical protein